MSIDILEGAGEIDLASRPPSIITNFRFPGCPFNTARRFSSGKRNIMKTIKAMLSGDRKKTSTLFTSSYSTEDV